MARELVLDKHNVFAVMTRIANEHLGETLPITNVTLSPEKKKETLPQQIVEILKNTGPFYKVSRKIYRTYRNIRYEETK